jgi:hypothetical protein
LQLQEYQSRTLYTTWDLSYTLLRTDEPEAARFLKLLAYFDNQSFWYELFLRGLGDESPEWLHIMINNEIRFSGVMRTLTDHCFVEVQTELKLWSMNRCVHDWRLAALNKIIDKQQYWYASDCVAASINEEDWDTLGFLSYGRVTAHATRLIILEIYIVTKES